ncbi:hypothetical protein CASFOL_023689 [Castilleja foliolosa]|uniref:Protein DEFECTIVE IN MERISTEM SILENCING 3 n=1 Tax=Castilleja foliolosa TaxID=1961234 RepID=A0ABD3CL81_9LAMI
MSGGSDHRRMSIDTEYFIPMPTNNSSAFVLSDPSAALRHAGQNPPFPKEEVPNGSISKPTPGMNRSQMSINNSSAFVLSDPSAALRHAGQNLPFPKEEIPNGSISKSPQGMNCSQKIQDDLKEFGEMIKHHEDNIKYLKSLKNKLEDSILDMQVAIGKYHTIIIPQEDNGEPVSGDSVEETLQHIHKYENSAAAVLCKMKANPESRASGYSLTTDVLGVVATLGKVDDPNLSRVLSEYLGLENMLAVVCKTYVGVRALEGYKDGSIDKNLGIHSLVEQPLGNRFVVICLENLRPYDGAIIVDDPQRRLDLLKPKLISGEALPGFIGFAVNMVMINNTHLYSISRNGSSLRETLFYNLFSDLQVYKSREDMLNAQPYITHGAISLDGGVIRSPGIYSLGQHQGDIDIKFPYCESRKISLPASYHDIENQLKETKWKKDRAHEDMLREQALLEHTKCNYEIKKKEYIELIAQSSAYAAQWYWDNANSSPRRFHGGKNSDQQPKEVKEAFKKT